MSDEDEERWSSYGSLWRVDNSGHGTLLIFEKEDEEKESYPAIKVSAGGIDGDTSFRKTRVRRKHEFVEVD